MTLTGNGISPKPIANTLLVKITLTPVRPAFTWGTDFEPTSPFESASKTENMNIIRIYLLVFIAANSANILAQTDILDARSNYSVGESVTVSGIITNDGNLGIVRYLQDETAGIALYPGGDWVSSGWDDPQPGDALTMTGVLSEYNGLLEVGPDNVTQVLITSSGNPLPEAQTITPSQLGENLEGEIAFIEGAVFTNGGTLITGNSTFSFSANGESGIIYVRNDNELVGSVLPAGEVNLYGIVSQFSFDGFGGYQLLPRGSADLIPTSAINLSTQVEQVNLSTNSFDLIWSTDVLGDSRVEYGLTPELGTEIINEDQLLSHVVSLTELEPGTIYWARVSSIAGEDSTSSTIRPYATVSESPGYMRAYFTREVDNSVATIEEASTLGTNTNDTIAAYIGLAQNTIDIAAYNMNNSAIEAAINLAVSNGVQIRYIAEGQNANLGLSNVDDSVPVHFRTDGEGSGMHNKFIIGDADNTERAFVLTGSTNFTTGNLNTDPNNVIIFGDQSLARAYTLEFEEMWGSDGPQPNATNARFGAEKTVNTPRKFIVGGSDVQLYFSPTDGTTSAILQAVESTDYDLSFATLSFTRNDLGAAVIEAGSSLFINPEGAIEDVNTSGSEYDAFIDAGISVYSHQGISGQLHHKYAIVDQSESMSDPTVVTGSHNWSTTAETTNDENTVIVHDERIANLYYQEFRGLLNAMGVGVHEAGALEPTCRIFPNPASTRLTLVLTENAQLGEWMEMRDVMGRLVLREQILNMRASIDVSGLVRGHYLVQYGSSAPAQLTIQ
jgi:phosphatidylserine/phosphatidylglycerophosphate/cardiolipin synthase-like enzyme